jgi:hypothetical protein
MTRIRASITKEIPEAVVLDTLEVLIGQGDKDMDAKEEVVKSCWSQDPVQANLHAYYKLASNTIQLIEGRTKIPDTTGSKRRCVVSSDDPSTHPDPDLDPVPDPELEAPQKGRRLSAGTIKGAATCTAIKVTTAAARMEPFAAADMTIATT